MRSVLPWTVAALAPLILASLVLEIWRGDFSAPWAYTRDALSNLMLIKTTLEQGWPLHNPLLGAPFGQDLYDFPVVAGDPLHLLIIKFFGLFSSNPATVMNLFFLAQFPLIGLAAFWALRRLAVETWVAVVCAALFALAPYHFYRGEIHVFLAGYWGVPLGLCLVLTLLMGKPLARRRGEPGMGLGPLPWWGLALVCVLIGMSEVYYAALTAVLLGVGILLGLLRAEWRRLLVTGATALAIIGATIAVAHAPTILYHARHGQNSEQRKARDPTQSETFGMKVTRLVLPVADHRIGPLAKLTNRWEQNAPPQLDETDPQALGSLATLGFLALLVIGLGLTAGAVRRKRVDPLLGAAATAAIATTLVGVSGGFSGVISYYLTDSIRSWNRYSIYLGFLGLLPIAWVLTRGRLALARRRLGVIPWATALAALVVIGLLDQTGSTIVPPYKLLKQQWSGEQRFFDALGSRLPRGAEIYEVPYYPFPEWGYELARGYLHTDAFKWSFGAMEGRPADWARALLSQPGGVVLPSVAAAGFDAVYVDNRLYPDDGRTAARALRAALGPPMLMSRDGRFSVYDLRPYARRVRALLGAPASAELANHTLHPPRAIFGSDFGPMTPAGTIFAQANDRWTTSPVATLDLDNPDATPRRARVQTRLATESATTVAVALPSGKLVKLGTGPGGTNFDRVITLAPGHNHMVFAAAIVPNPNRRNYLDVANFRLMDETARSLALKAGARLG